jgi:hypothetical protein
MPLDAPFRLGPFLVDAQGRLHPSGPDLCASFRLSWRGCPVNARLDSGGPAATGQARLALSAVVGRVPSTAGGDPARRRERRGAIFDTLQGLQTDAAAPAHLRLLPDHRVTVEGARQVALPASAGDLVTQITCFLLDLAPYLDVLADAGVPVETVAFAGSGRGGTLKI